MHRDSILSHCAVCCRSWESAKAAMAGAIFISICICNCLCIYLCILNSLSLYLQLQLQLQLRLDVIIISSKCNDLPQQQKSPSHRLMECLSGQGSCCMPLVAAYSLPACRVAGQLTCSLRYISRDSPESRRCMWTLSMPNLIKAIAAGKFPMI